MTRVRSVLRLVHEIDRRRAREQELLEVMRQLQEANQMLLRLSCLDGLTGITNRRQFDDFLDHGRAYLDNGQKNQAGVIAGVVFEDTTRRIAKLHGINTTGAELDSVISQLARSGVITGGMAKRARASAHVRTKATHAEWDEFTASDVEATIAVADELILRHLGR